jgi:cation diffusion facilitator family transporter
MSHFPSPILPPESIYTVRRERNRQLIQAAGWGIAIRSSIITFELIGVFLFGSSALLMDALASLVDVICTLLLILFIKLAERPPDENHPFGHGRYEPLIGLQLGLFLALVGGGMLFYQTFQLSQIPHDQEMSKYAWLFAFFALLLLEICYRIVMRTAKKQNSPALATDAVHYRIDSITSLFATIALVIAAYFPVWSLTIDHIGAVMIALLMIGLGLYAAKNNFNQLMDHIPDRRFFEKVRHSALRVQGVRETEKIRIQLYGPDAHVDIDVEVDPQMVVKDAHQISQQVRVQIQKDWPAVRDVTVHIEPYYQGDH